MNPQIVLKSIDTNEIKKLIASLQERFFILIATDYIQQALHISNQISFFYMGKWIKIRKTKKILKVFAKKLTKNYILDKIWQLFIKKDFMFENYSFEL